MAWCVGCRREKCESPDRSSRELRFLVLPTVPGSFPFQNREDRCPDTSSADFQRTAPFHPGGCETIVYDPLRTDDRARTGRPDRAPLPVPTAWLATGVAGNL